MAAIKEYKCPCCGGAVEFDSKIQKIKCPYCDTEFDTEAFTAHEEEVQNAKPDEMDWETTAGGAWEQVTAQAEWVSAVVKVVIVVVALAVIAWWVVKRIVPAMKEKDAAK